MSAIVRLLTSSAIAAAGLAAAAQADILRHDTVLTTVVGDEAEIPAYDSGANRFFVVGIENDASFVRVVDAANGNVAGMLDLGDGTANSVAVSTTQVAVAVEAANKTDPGRVLVWNLSDLNAAPASYTVGALPDQLTFTPDQSRIVVANEGEPEGYEDGQLDPEGSISIIDLGTGTVATADFNAFDSRQAELQAAGVRIFGPGASVSQDLEPEFAAINADGTTAFVTLQENNAVAVVDLATATVTDILPLGFKSWQPGDNELDPSDRDGGPGNFQSLEGLYGLYQPDAILTVEANGQTYFITADEGDARDYDGFEEEERGDDQGLSGDFARLELTNTLGADGPADGQYYTFGGRGFSIRDTAGNIIYDSGDLVEKIVTNLPGGALNDKRSDAKGPEPEAVAFGMVDGVPVLFLGLERANGGDLGTILTFSLEGLGFGTDPEYLGAITSDLLGRPEGLTFFMRDGQEFLAAADEETGNLVVFALNIVPAPAALGLLGLGLGGLAAMRRKRK
ncbi:choice-of-anchor I family protein [Pacificimonas sp. WHA3]|uniref:Choice-of-anchor I family protein n=1 Tax=Pacificimonas pallii TaxID=2827236 RepID=A0ABS6SGC3_9SPHN|nr:choice-of-anchor I family protein [Pacificimonas pallii]MBV7257457.1 choice-of-anchor I family protein [Pacificimonas pallii]